MQAHPAPTPSDHAGQALLFICGKENTSLNLSTESVQGQGAHQKVMLRSLDCMERIEVVCLWSATPCQGPLSLEEQLQARHDISSLNEKMSQMP